LILLAAFVAQAQAAIFAPPLDTPFRIVSERVQHDESGRRSFRAERLIRFARDGIGYRAEVRVLAAEAPGQPDEVAAMFEAGWSGLRGETLVFRLDGAGNVVGVDDRDRVWLRFCDGLGRIFAVRRSQTAVERAQFAERVAAPLVALPEARQLEILGSLVEVAIVRDALAVHGERPIRLPAASPYGGRLMLEGTRAIVPAGPLYRITTRAGADVAGDIPAHVAMAIERDADPATGLLAATTETVVTRIADPAGERRIERVSRTTVEKLPASDWPR
jgi:hypothetical protein